MPRHRLASKRLIAPESGDATQSLQQSRRRPYGNHLIPLTAGDRQAARGRGSGPACTTAEAEAMAERRRVTAWTRTLIAAVALAAPAAVAACTPPGGGGSGSSAPANDVVGGGGQLDQAYRQIYTPGRGTNF